MTFPLPYVICASDGQAMRTLQGSALGRHRAAIEAALADLLLEPPPSVAPPPPAPAGPAAASPTLTQHELARDQGFTGDSCRDCGSFAVKRSGTCATCTACGSTTGCG